MKQGHQKFNSRDWGWSRGLPINNTTKTSCVGLFPPYLGVLRKRELGRWLSNVVETSPTRMSVQLASGGRFRAETSKLARKT